MNGDEPASVARPDIEEIESLLAETTPGPWYVRGFDDGTAATLIAVATEPDDGIERRWPDFPHRDIVAVTLLQSGVPFSHRSGKAERNAQLIARTPEYLSQLVAEVKRLRGLGIEQD